MKQGSNIHHKHRFAAPRRATHLVWSKIAPKLAKKARLLGKRIKRHHGLQQLTVGVVAILVFGLISPLLFKGHVVAFANWDQAFWSDGQDNGTYSGPVAFYKSINGLDPSAPSGITVDTATSGVTWCSTADCTTSWTRRQAVYLQADADYGTIEVPLVVTYLPAMKSDFSDLRFTTSDGQTDLNYKLNSFVSNTSASVSVEVPSITTGGAPPSIQMYYGNAAATSLSADLGSLDSANSLQAYFGIEEFVGGYTGSVESVIYDLTNSHTTFGNAHLTKTGTGNVGLYVRFGHDAISDQPYVFCNFIHDGESLDNVSSDCRDPYNRYFQFTLVLAADSSANLAVTNTGIEYTEDHDSPADPSNLVTYDHEGGTQVADGEATASQTPFFAWDAGAINDQGTGPLAPGFCAYLGTESNPDLYNSSTVLDPGSSPASGVFCPYATSDSFLDPIAHGGISALTPGETYYFIIRAYDTWGNISGNGISTSFVALGDSEAPSAPSNIVVSDAADDSLIADNAWSRTTNPHYTWDAATDGDGTGVLGYCLYFGTDNTADPATTAGDITNLGLSGDSGGACQFMGTGTGVNPTQLSASLTTGNTYYLRIRTLDNSGNLSTVVTSTSFRSDNQEPQDLTVYFGPSGVINTRSITFNWALLGSVSDGSGSGVAGYKYCVTNALIGFGGCDGAEANWFGANHSSGNIRDASDVIPFSAGGFTLQPSDYDRIDDQVVGINIVYAVLVDNAGNIHSVNLPGGGAVVISHEAPTTPTSLAATPTSNTSNAFSFNWSPPVTYIGPSSQIDYCWTVNEVIATNGSNCHWTGQAITSLASGPYATQQGANVLRVMAKDQTSNFNRDNAASVTFTASTTAPGVPQDLDVTDVSVRATSAWKLAMSWTAPTQVGAGISNYKIYRSVDNSTFTQVGSTSNSNLSFIDSGLSQQLYYYYVKACDNANSCSVASSTVSKQPTGRYTQPPLLTADTNQPRYKDITPSKATIFWFTDRESDSKVAFGTSPGQYLHEERGNSNQTASHSVTLSNLQPNTKYYYIARWTDSDGNTGTSQERSFTTQPAPTVSDVTSSKITLDSALINFSVSNTSRVVLSYGPTASLGSAEAINTSADSSTYNIKLSQLLDGSKYFFKLALLDADGNQTNGDTYSFTTLARPKISNLRFEPVAGEPSSTLKVSWNTNVPTTSEVSYGPKGGKILDASSSPLVTDHTIVLKDLIDDTVYGLTARSRDAAGVAATSDEQTIHTSLDTRPPKMTDVTIESSVRGTGSSARGQIIVSWKTDEPSTSQVAIGQGQAGPLTNRTGEDTRLATQHTVVVPDLPTSTVYHVSAVSYDKARNISTSDNQSAIIGRASQNVFTIIFTALRNIFGVGD